MPSIETYEINKRMFILEIGKVKSLTTSNLAEYLEYIDLNYDRYARCLKNRKASLDTIVKLRKAGINVKWFMTESDFDSLFGYVLSDTESDNF